MSAWKLHACHDVHTFLSLVISLLMIHLVNIIIIYTQNRILRAALSGSIYNYILIILPSVNGHCCNITPLYSSIQDVDIFKLRMFLVRWTKRTRCRRSAALTSRRRWSSRDVPCPTTTSASTRCSRRRCNRAGASALTSGTYHDNYETTHQPS